MHVEDIIHRIENMRYFGLTLEEIHDRIVLDSGVSEGMFFLCWKATEVRMRRNT